MCVRAAADSFCFLVEARYQPHRRRIDGVIVGALLLPRRRPDIPELPALPISAGAYSLPTQSAMILVEAGGQNSNVVS